MTALHHTLDGPTDAPVLVLSGSLGTDLSMWEPQLGLAERFRLLRVDNRGHGRSPAPPGPYTIPELGGDVLELLDALGLERVAFAGVSIGGMIGLWLAAREPGRVTGLVAICTAAHVEDREAFRRRAAVVREAGTTEGIADAVVDRWLTAGFAADHPAERERLRAMLLATDPEGYASCAEAVGALELRAELASISTPTLVVSGEQDTALPVALQREIVVAVPGARHVILDPSAHIASVERADAVNRLITEHLT